MAILRWPIDKGNTGAPTTTTPPPPPPPTTTTTSAMAIIKPIWIYARIIHTWLRWIKLANEIEININFISQIYCLFYLLLTQIAFQWPQHWNVERWRQILIFTLERFRRSFPSFMTPMLLLLLLCLLFLLFLSSLSIQAAAVLFGCSISETVRKSGRHCCAPPVVYGICLCFTFLYWIAE